MQMKLDTLNSILHAKREGGETEIKIEGHMLFAGHFWPLIDRRNLPNGEVRCNYLPTITISIPHTGRVKLLSKLAVCIPKTFLCLFGFWFL